MEETYLHAMETVPLRDIVKHEYRTYQIYTLMDRAIPYLQDGLKPVQRRILYTLWKNQSKGLIKVSAATGLVLTLHPHGPASIETAVVNMAQDYTFSNNYPLVDKKGYFGERMETAPAASRYIECRLGKIAKVLLFDDMNQVQMVPNFDETTVEPDCLYPKLPIMLLNGAEGIGTGFSSVIPSFHHRDLIASIVSYLQTGKAKKLKPHVEGYNHKIVSDNGRYLFSLKLEQKGEKFHITELPKGYDAKKTYRFLNALMDKDIIKDYIDSTVNNDVNIELVFKRGQTPSFEEVQKSIAAQASLVPNYTLISERGVRIFEKPEEIIEIFAEERLKVVRRRYELLCEDYEKRIRQNNEIIKFIRQKEYEVATKTKNRKTFVEHLTKKKFTFSDYLADMPIYRMTKEEVNKRKLMVQDDSKALKQFQKIAKSPTLVRKKLIEELAEVNKQMDDWLKDREKDRKDLLKKLNKSRSKTVTRKKKTTRR
ncbi:MAG: DNA gyrase subunit A [Bacteriovoracaceae bacterium]